jgi:hypothetical protein
LFILLLIGLYWWKGWFIWAALIFVLGLDHPPVLYPQAELDGKRKIIGAATVIIFLLCYMPFPFGFVPPAANP